MTGKKKSSLQAQTCPTQKKKMVLLNSVYNSSNSLIYHWNTEDRTRVFHSIERVISFMCNRIPTLNYNHIILDADENSDLSTIQKLCSRFNEATVDLLQQNTAQNLAQNFNRESLEEVIKSVYYEAVIDPTQLNKYKPFSEEVYGETTYETVAAMIDAIKMTSDDVFIDLGSGVGQVVLQVAADAECKISYGIEQGAIPAMYADRMGRYFCSRMKWQGYHYGHFLLLEGDFLDASFRQKIDKATVIFVNNLMFTEQMDQKLQEIFMGLREGTRIVSTRSFRKSNFRINPRTCNDIGAILEVSEIQGSGSWTSTPVRYYLHTIDRTKLRRFQRTIRIKAIWERARKNIGKRPLAIIPEEEPQEMEVTEECNAPKICKYSSKERKVLQDCETLSLKRLHLDEGQEAKAIQIVKYHQHQTRAKSRIQEAENSDASLYNSSSSNVRFPESMQPELTGRSKRNLTQRKISENRFETQVSFSILPKAEVTIHATDHNVIVDTDSKAGFLSELHLISSIELGTKCMDVKSAEEGMESERRVAVQIDKEKDLLQPCRSTYNLQAETERPLPTPDLFQFGQDREETLLESYQSLAPGAKTPKENIINTEKSLMRIRPISRVRGKRSRTKSYASQTILSGLSTNANSVNHEKFENWQPTVREKLDGDIVHELSKKLHENTKNPLPECHNSSNDAVLKDVVHVHGTRFQKRQAEKTEAVTSVPECTETIPILRTRKLKCLPRHKIVSGFDPQTTSQPSSKLDDGKRNRLKETPSLREGTSARIQQPTKIITESDENRVAVVSVACQTESQEHWSIGCSIS